MQINSISIGLIILIVFANSNFYPLWYLIEIITLFKKVTIIKKIKAYGPCLF